MSVDQQRLSFWMTLKVKAYKYILNAYLQIKKSVLFVFNSVDLMLLK
jgi:hypothetical protein